MTIVASRAGFYPSGKRALISHSLVGLLQQTNRGFEAVSNILSLFRFISYQWLLINMEMCSKFAGLQGSYEGFC